MIYDAKNMHLFCGFFHSDAIVGHQHVVVSESFDCGQGSGYKGMELFNLPVAQLIHLILQSALDKVMRG
jgi:hypothetical protein